MRSFCPQLPEGRVDWAAIDEALPWIRALKGCPQDPIHHAEGDVWIHTRIVCEALAGMKAWRDLPERIREILFWSALLHDVAKPACTRHEDGGRVSSRGHARRGANDAQRILWELGMPFEDRQNVVHLVRHHTLPFWLIERTDAPRTLTLVSQTTRCDWLAILAEADARGRICQDPERILENVALFAELAREHRCLAQPRAFASEHGRFLYARDEWREIDLAPHEDFSSDVVLMSGMPGVGKDTWIRRHLPGWPVVSLDDIRQRLGVRPTERQGTVVQAAREKARQHLRQGTSFVWNATNLSRQVRGACVGLCAAYKARVRIVYLEASPERLRRQNRERDTAVPQKVLDKLLQRWEVPDPYEGHQVDYVVE